MKPAGKRVKYTMYTYFHFDLFDFNGRKLMMKRCLPILLAVCMIVSPAGKGIYTENIYAAESIEEGASVSYEVSDAEDGFVYEEAYDDSIEEDAAEEIRGGLRRIEFTRIPDGSFDEPEGTEDINDSVEADNGLVYKDAYWDQFTGYFFYNQLKPNEKQLYDNLMSACIQAISGEDDYTKEKFPDEFVLPASPYGGLSDDDMWDVVEMFVYNNPQFYFVKNHVAWDKKNVYLMCYGEFHLGTDRTEATNAIKSKLNSWMGEVCSKSTEFEKEKAAHDVICRDVAYQHNSLDQSIYSAIIMKKTVCVGYAGCLYMLLNAAGIDSGIINSVSHDWNIVRINGIWYNLDATWDDQENGNTYKYFNRSLAKIKDSSHTMMDSWKRFMPDLTADSGGGATSAESATGTNAKPKITQTKVGDAYQIKITSEGGAKIYYTLNGSEPNVAYSKSTLYTGPFAASFGETVKAKTTKSGLWDSDMVYLTAGTEKASDPVEEEEKKEEPEEKDKEATVKRDEVIPVIGISVTGPDGKEASGYNICIGKSTQLNAKVIPSNATDTKINWSSDDPMVASVSQNGRITARSVGLCKITAKTSDGGFTSECSVRVIAYISKLNLDQTTVNLGRGNSVKIGVTAVCDDAETALAPEVTWSVTSGQGIVSVDDEGTITALSEGSAKVMAQATDGSGKSAVCNVKVMKALDAKELVPTGKSGLTEAAGESGIMLKVKDSTGKFLNPKDVRFYSADPTVASVYTNGAVTGVAPGETKIYAYPANALTAASSDPVEIGVTITENTNEALLAGKVTGPLSISVPKAVPGKDVELFVNKSVKLAVRDDGKGAAPAKGQVVFYSSDEKIVSVSSQGAVTALAPGEATVTAVSIFDSTVLASIKVISKPEVKGIILNANKLTLGKEQTGILCVTQLNPANAVDHEVCWTASDADVLFAVIDKDTDPDKAEYKSLAGGTVVTDIGKGEMLAYKVKNPTKKCAVTASVNGCKKKAVCNITVVGTVTDMALKEGNGLTLTGKDADGNREYTLSLAPGASFPIKVDFGPQNSWAEYGADKTILYESTDTGVAAVAKAGKISVQKYAESGDTVDITASTVDGMHKAVIHLSVK